jgi:hypothetical protein
LGLPDPETLTNQDKRRKITETAINAHLLSLNAVGARMADIE